MDLASVRLVIGEVLNSPKQPQPMSGLMLRSSIRAKVATMKSRQVPNRTSLAGAPAPNWPAVRISPMPRPSSTAQSVPAASGRSFSGNSAVGPSAAPSDRRWMARRELGRAPAEQHGGQHRYLDVAQLGQHVSARS